MTPAESEALAKRIINVWRLTPALDEWSDALVGYEHAQAVATLRALRTEVDGALSIARFVKRYRELGEASAPATARRRRGPSERCELCEGCGFVDVPGPVEVVNGEPHPYTALAPCPCTGAPTPFTQETSVGN